jgi:phosphoribosylformimino-5-aminoimidazole carboxamide ribotide isomerase
MRFRPCIDLHQGQVKQIVGSTLGERGSPLTNFTADRPPSYYAARYRRDGLEGGHVIMLGPGNEEAAAAALAAYPGGLQLGGGIDADNAPRWLERGAGKVIVTSYVFREGRLPPDRLARVAAAAGREQLVLDLSCARRGDRYVVMTDRWQRASDFAVTRENLELLAASCSEFLVHATAVEGKQEGIDAELVALLGEAAPLPTTYAGGIRDMADIALIGRLGQGRLDFTVGSALDLFGGKGLRYADLAAFNRRPP